MMLQLPSVEISQTKRPVETAMVPEYAPISFTSRSLSPAPHAQTMKFELPLWVRLAVTGCVLESGNHYCGIAHSSDRT